MERIRLPRSPYPLASYPYIVVDGYQISAIVESTPDVDYSCTVEDRTGRYELILDLSISEVMDLFSSFQVKFVSNPFRNFISSVTFASNINSPNSTLSIFVGDGAIKWKLPYSIEELQNSLDAHSWLVDGLNFMPRMHIWYPLENARLTFQVVNTGQKLGELLANALPIVVSQYEEVTAGLLASIDHDSLMSLFRFPVEIRVSCEQYLLYFVKFLCDVGIEATAKIEEQAGKTLFSVTPTNEKNALEKIKLALEVYLHLPASLATNINLPLSADIATQQLTANVQHLQGNLLLARATMQAQSATIQAKDIIIEQQQNLINQQIQAGTILLESRISQSQPRPTALLTDSNKEVTEEREEIVRGAVSLKKWEWEMFEVDFPNLIRRLKEWFKDKDAPE